MKTLLILVISINLYALEGKVRNGGDIATRNFIFAAKQLSFYISKCISTKSCNVNSEEILTLESIKKITDPSLLVFVNDKNSSGIFTVNGIEKAAVTGDKPGSLIYINVNKTKGMSISNAVALLVHEFGHHLAVIDHTWLDHLGVKVGLVASESFSLYNIMGTKRFSFQIYYTNNTNPYVNLFVNDDFIDIAPEILNMKLCPSNTSLSTFEITNLFQESLGKHNGLEMEFEINLWLRITCKNLNKENLRFFIKEKINLSFDMTKDKPIFLE